jgi:hypothetical protein
VPLKLRLVFRFRAGFFVGLQSPGVFQFLVEYPLDLAIYTSKFILCPLFESLIGFIINSYDKRFLKTHAKPVFVPWLINCSIARAKEAMSAVLKKSLFLVVRYNCIPAPRLAL